MNYTPIIQQIPIFATVLTSTILILRFLADNRKYSMDRQKEIKEEIASQVKRDHQSESQGKDLLRLTIEFQEFRTEMKKELSDLRIMVMRLLPIPKKEQE